MDRIWAEYSPGVTGEYNASQDLFSDSDPDTDAEPEEIAVEVEAERYSQSQQDQQLDPEATDLPLSQDSYPDELITELRQVWDKGCKCHLKCLEQLNMMDIYWH